MKRLNQVLVKRILLVFVSFCLLLLSGSSSVFAQNNTDNPDELTNSEYKEEILEGKIVRVLEEKNILSQGSENEYLYQELSVLVTKGSLDEKEIVVESGNIESVNTPKYKVGDKVLVSYSKDFEGNDVFYITDFIRRTPLLVLFLIFVVLTVAIAKVRGFLSILGMGASFLVIFLIVLPRILSGADPVETAILASMIIIPITFFLSHGFNKKTGVAIAGTLISLIVTGVLANIFVEATKLSGFVAEEAGFLQAVKGNTVNIKGLLLAGIIIGVLGVLDDITISQSAIVFQLKETNGKLKFRELYRRAMDVGRDHISSMVNTLILVYTGAALPLLLLFVNNPHPFSEVINYEIIADEIVRTLVGSIGLVLAVPVTTLIASLVVDERFK